MLLIGWLTVWWPRKTASPIPVGNPKFVIFGSWTILHKLLAREITPICSLYKEKLQQINLQQINFYPSNLFFSTQSPCTLSRSDFRQHVTVFKSCRYIYKISNLIYSLNIESHLESGLGLKIFLAMLPHTPTPRYGLPHTGFDEKT